MPAARRLDLLPPAAGALSGFWRWRPLLPLRGLARPVTLGEGGTPLLPSRRFGPRVLWKDETRNPTGSHKDRPLALALTHAVETGARLVAVFSAGSTGLSAAAYAARAGLPCAILMTEGAPAERVAPLSSLGARLIELPVAIDEGIAALAALSGRHGLYVASTTRAANPVQAEASRSLAYEIVEALGRAPDRVVIPVGGGGTVAALHDGFVQLRAMGATDRLPRLIGVVPDRYDTLATALARGVATETEFLALPDPRGGPTVLDKIAHAHPPDGVHALAALRESGGRVMTVSDEEALAAVEAMGTGEGLFVEPSSAVAWVALQRLEAAGALAGTTVAVACGSGFRETHVLLARRLPARERVGLGDLEAVLARMAEEGG
jgi:threonine synthase